MKRCSCCWKGLGPKEETYKSDYREGICKSCIENNDYKFCQHCDIYHYQDDHRKTGDEVSAGKQVKVTVTPINQLIAAEYMTLVHTPPVSNIPNNGVLQKPGKSKRQANLSLLEVI